MAKTYRGMMVHGDCHVIVREDGKRPRILPLRLDLANHSPSGFNWGYGGSGPAQLSLALCADLVGDERARHVYQEVKFTLVMHLPQGEEFLLPARDLLAHIERAEKHMEQGCGPF